MFRLRIYSNLKVRAGFQCFNIASILFQFLQSLIEGYHSVSGLDRNLHRSQPAFQFLHMFHIGSIFQSVLHMESSLCSTPLFRPEVFLRSSRRFEFYSSSRRLLQEQLLYHNSHTSVSNMMQKGVLPATYPNTHYISKLHCSQMCHNISAVIKLPHPVYDGKFLSAKAVTFNYNCRNARL